jgi:hypothetical protein
MTPNRRADKQSVIRHLNDPLCKRYPTRNVERNNADTPMRNSRSIVLASISLVLACALTATDPSYARPPNCPAIFERLGGAIPGRGIIPEMLHQSAMVVVGKVTHQKDSIWGVQVDRVIVDRTSTGINPGHFVSITPADPCEGEATGYGILFLRRDTAENAFVPLNRVGYPFPALPPSPPSTVRDPKHADDATTQRALTSELVNIFTAPISVATDPQTGLTAGSFSIGTTYTVPDNPEGDPDGKTRSIRMTQTVFMQDRYLDAIRSLYSLPPAMMKQEVKAALDKIRRAPDFSLQRLWLSMMMLRLDDATEAGDASTPGSLLNALMGPEINIAAPELPPWFLFDPKDRSELRAITPLLASTNLVVRRRIAEILFESVSTGGDLPTPQDYQFAELLPLVLHQLEHDPDAKVRQKAISSLCYHVGNECSSMSEAHYGQFETWSKNPEAVAHLVQAASAAIAAYHPSARRTQN